MTDRTTRTVWKCAYQGGPTYVYPTLHDTEAEAEAHAKHLAQTQGIRGAVIYPIELED